MKAQEIFDISAKHLLTQNKKAQDRDSIGGICRYRGPNETKCAIGCLITDQMYSKEMEGIGVADLMKEYPEIKRKFGVRNIELLDDLQSCHDGWPVHTWQGELGIIAKRYKLDPGVIKGVTK